MGYAARHYCVKRNPTSKTIPLLLPISALTLKMSVRLHVRVRTDNGTERVGDGKREAPVQQAELHTSLSYHHLNLQELSSS